MQIGDDNEKKIIKKLMSKIEIFYFVYEHRELSLLDLQLDSQ